VVKISVIIPVYNCEKYLSKCLDSIVNQTLQDIEIICINDGSPDNSQEILELYAKKYSNIKIIVQENKRQGAARNRGLDIADGEFITFVDSDDWIESDYLELLYNAAIEHNVNISAASIVRDKRNKSVWYLRPELSTMYTGASEILQGIDMHLETAGKLYRFKPIKDLRFQEGVFFEDAGYTIRAINELNTLVTVPKAVYHYVSNQSSTVKNSNLNDDKIITSLDVINYAEKNNIKLKDFPIIKERHKFYTIKHYKYKKDYYFLGIKLFSRNLPFDYEYKPLDKKFSIIIPTLQKNKEVLQKLVVNLDNDDSVGEILLIDNSLKGIDFTANKLKIIVPDENLFVNPSWNLGVDKAQFGYIGLLNDDIIIPENFCTNVISKLQPTFGVVGMNRKFIVIGDQNDLPKSQKINIYFEEAEYRCEGFGVAMFMPKSSYIAIPNEMKIMYGDDWLMNRNEKAGRRNYFISGAEIIHLGSLSTSNTSLKPIFKIDSKIYRQITVKWYNRLFSIQKRENDYKLRFLGITFKIKR